MCEWNFPASSCYQMRLFCTYIYNIFLSPPPPTYFVIKLLSGLDAFQAEKVMETLQQLAQDGHTVICSIHQPRGSVYSKFDDIVLLTEGSLVYAGPARDEPLTYFSKFG